MEYFGSDRMFQSQDFSAQRRLFDAHRPRSAIEAAMIGGGDRIAKLTDIKRQAL